VVYRTSEERTPMENTEVESEKPDRFTSALGFIADLAEKRNAERDALRETTDMLRKAVVNAIQDGFLSEAQAAVHADVDRMTVRKWLGKR
jgi:hypothetical protein